MIKILYEWGLRTFRRIEIFGPEDTAKQLEIPQAGTLPQATPADLAIYTRCDVDRISHWIGQRIEYKEQGPVWDSADVCMERGWGDCKCSAIVARDTLNSCNSYEARIVVLRGPRSVLHACTLFQDHKNRRGYINGIGRRLFEPGTPWQDITQAIPGGPWTEL